MKKKRTHALILISLIAIVIASVSSGYWLYQKSIHNVIHSTTTSFMEELASHDHQNMLNQMESNWNILHLVTERLASSQDSSIEDVCHNMNLNVLTTSFENIYLISEGGTVYSHSATTNSLDEMKWADIYSKHTGTFADTYSEEKDAQWDEYVVYGIHLDAPISVEDETISGIIGFVSASSLNEQLRIDSSYNEGMAIIIKPDGESLTSSQEYDRGANNYFEMLQASELEEGYTWDMVQSHLDNREKQIFRFYPPVRDYGYYTLIEPLNDPYDTGWFLVVQLSEQITTTQVNQLLVQSIFFFIVVGLICIAVVLLILYNANKMKTLRLVEQTKTDFLTSMSHEIRTPLNGISGLCYLMKENIDDKEKLEDYLDQTVASTIFLKDIINDVLDMSKIESGKLALVQKELSLSKLLLQTKTLLDPNAKQKNINLTVDYENLKADRVVGDETRIKQILTNLLGNAIKFTPNDGSVSLSATQEIEKSLAKTTFVVKDNGCGMSKEFLKKIWSPFEQERQISSQNGTGLGTSITKALVDEMKGTITVESEVDNGTTFTITISFPIAAVEKEIIDENIPVLAPHRIDGMNILIVEDNNVNRLILSNLLMHYSCNITEATNGQDAVDTFKSKPDNYFDLILMDLQMPVLNGYEASKKIRSSSKPDAKSVTIFAVTANAFQEDLDNAIKAGMNDAITKPIDIPLLLDKLSKVKSSH